MSGPELPYPGPPPGYPASTEVVAASPRGLSSTVLVSLVVSGLFAGVAPVGEAILAQRAWNDCDPAISASANSLGMLVIGLPLLVAANTLLVLIVSGLTWWATRSARHRGLWMCVASTLAVVVLAYVLWVVWVTPAGDATSICPGGVPPWAPRWLPS